VLLYAGLTDFQTLDLVAITDIQTIDLVAITDIQTIDLGCNLTFKHLTLVPITDN